jgi:AraC-like DNA-binding protein
MDRGQMRGGTNSGHVSGSVFAMPAGMRLRYDHPAPQLAEYVTGYAVYAADDSAPTTNWYLPGPAMISVLVDAGPVTVSVRHHQFGPLDRVSLYGPTSRAIRMQTNGGITANIGISALGWARLTRRPAGDFHNRIVPLSDVMGAVLSADLLDGLDALNDDARIKPLLDRILEPLFKRPHSRDEVIRAFTALSVTGGVIEVRDVAEQLGIATHDLRRIATRHFGMPPKLLLRRARFLRSFIRLITDDDLAEYSLIDSSYFDVSHFLKDASTFLGTTPRRFYMSDTTFLRASLRARAAVLGSPTEALQSSPSRSLPLLVDARHS